MQNLVLAFDLVNQTLVSFQGSSLNLSQFSQTKYNVRLYIVQPVPNAIPGLSQYETITYADYDSVRIGIWSNSTGTLGDSAGLLLALTDSIGWTLATDDDGFQYFSGVFNVNTTQIATFLGVSASKAAFFACNLVLGADLYRVFDQKGGSTNCIVNSATDEFSGAAIDVTAQVPTLILPITFLHPDSGEQYVLDRTAQGQITFTWANPPP